jgi:hypothetical protein
MNSVSADEKGGGGADYVVYVFVFLGSILPKSFIYQLMHNRVALKELEILDASLTLL